MRRTVEPELLDRLPADHPDALASRRDLARINCLMGNDRWWHRFFKEYRQPGARVLEVGAGDGLLATTLRMRFPLLHIDGLDIAPRPATWPEAAQWHTCDLLNFDRYSDYDIVFGNMVLHHFDQKQLAQLGRELQKGPRILAFCEPARSPLHIAQFKAVSCLGFNRVSRHDGPVSIAAGFRGIELPISLRLLSRDWKVQRKATWLGAYRMIAERNAAT